MTALQPVPSLNMVKKTKPLVDESDEQSDEVFEKAAEVFRVMSAPMRLRIISALCNGEKNVGELLAEIQTTQPNMSQHLNTLYLAGVLGKRREGSRSTTASSTTRWFRCAGRCASRSPAKARRQPEAGFPLWKPSNLKR